MTLKTQDVLIFDIESASVEQLFTRPDFYRLGAFANGSGPVLTTDGNELARAVAAAPHVSGHNITGFDLIVLARWHGLSLPSLLNKVIDTDLAVRLDDPPPSGKDGIAIRPKGYYGLDQSCERYGVQGKVNDLGRLAKKFGGHDMIPLDDPEYREYLIGDIEASTGLLSALPPANEYTKREMNVGLITAQMTLNGFRVDVPELQRTLVEQADRKERNYHELSELSGMPLGKWKRFKRKADEWEPFVNPLASEPGREAIHAKLEALGIKGRHLPKTNTGKPSVSGDDMKALREKVVKYGGNDRIVRILDLVISLVAERTVYQTADEYRIDDRVHPSIRPYQASGRWSVTKPGLTVYGKRKGKHVERRIFLPEEGHRILAVDLDQVDARAVAAHSGDEGYISIFTTPGPDGKPRDLHVEVAKAVFGTPTMREQAKAISHGWNYGEGPNKMAQNGVPIDLAVQFDQMMRRKYPKLVEWQRDVRAVAQNGDLLDNGFGRKMRADPRFAYTQAPALVGQGCTRDILAEGLLRLPVEFWPYLRVVVHDEIVLSVPEKDYDEIAREVVRCMTFDLGEVTNGRLTSVPITAGFSKPGRTWAEVYEK